MTGITGVIEGFYGTPWTWAERRLLCDAVVAAGGETYVYAPKDDPLHRDRWREPYPDDWLGSWSELAGGTSARIGIAISPGLSIDVDDEHDRAVLLGKVHQILDAGGDLVVLTLDDVPFHDGQGAEHGRLGAWLRDRLDPTVTMALVPNHYTGTVDSPYLAGLRAELPREVPVGWTGPTVVCDRIAAADAAAWSEMMDGRAPLLWDNHPVNDLVMGDRLFLAPLRGREPELASLLSGYLANGGVQARASVAAVRSAVAWALEGDPDREFAVSIGPAAALASCVDEHRLAPLIDAAEADGDWTAVDALLAAAERCDDGGLGDGVEPWVDAARSEAGVGRAAVRLLRGAGTAAHRSLELLALGVTWPTIRRHGTSVFGPRQGFRPVLGQSPTGDWLCDPSSFDHDRNQIDRLVRLALAAEALR